MSSKWVFGSRNAPREIAYFTLMHLLLFTIGQILIWLASNQGIENKLALSAIIIAFTAPISFFWGRFVFTKKLH
jgi:putative flippase GtrA